VWCITQIYQVQLKTLRLLKEKYNKIMWSIVWHRFLDSNPKPWVQIEKKKLYLHFGINQTIHHNIPYYHCKNHNLIPVVIQPLEVWNYNTDNTKCW
jgi:SPX domain protein involved in polyphosphate accumulation